MKIPDKILPRQRRETVKQYSVRLFLYFRTMGAGTMLTPAEAKALAKPYGVTLPFREDIDGGWEGPHIYPAWVARCIAEKSTRIPNHNPLDSSHSPAGNW